MCCGPHRLNGPPRAVLLAAGAPAAAGIPFDEMRDVTREAGVTSLYQRHGRRFTGTIGLALLGAGDNASDDSSAPRPPRLARGVRAR